MSFRLLALTGALVLSCVAPVAAQICGGCIEPANSTVPACITLVGRDGVGAADPRGQFTVIVRDLANNPVANALVRVDLGAAPDLVLCGTQEAGLVVNTSAGSMYAEGRTNALGQITMSLVGSSNGTGNATTLLSGGRIFSDGRLIGSPTVSALDLDGAGGVGINDLSAWLADFAASQPFGRSDYDCNGSVGINDLSIWLAAYGASSSAYGCTP